MTEAYERYFVQPLGCQIS